MYESEKLFVIKILHYVCQFRLGTKKVEYGVKCKGYYLQILFGISP